LPLLKYISRKTDICARLLILDEASIKGDQATTTLQRHNQVGEIGASRGDATLSICTKPVQQTLHLQLLPEGAKLHCHWVIRGWKAKLLQLTRITIQSCVEFKKKVRWLAKWDAAPMSLLQELQRLVVTRFSGETAATSTETSITRGFIALVAAPLRVNAESPRDGYTFHFSSSFSGPMAS
jgi:hypothetical protein